MHRVGILRCRSLQGLEQAYTLHILWAEIIRSDCSQSMWQNRARRPEHLSHENHTEIVAASPNILVEGNCCSSTRQNQSGSSPGDQWIPMTASNDRPLTDSIPQAR